MSRVELVHQLSRRDAPFGSIDLNRGTMSVRRAYIDHIIAQKAAESDVNVCLDVFYEMPDVYVAICIR